MTRSGAFRLGAPPTVTGPPKPVSGPPLPLARALDGLQQRRQAIDRMIERTLRGEQLTARQLLLWQARVYAYSERVELLSRLVDRTTAALKTVLTTQGG